MAKKKSDLENLEFQLMQNPEYVAEYSRSKPFADLAMKIIKARIEAGLTQAELAERMGTTQSVISRIEAFDYEGVKYETIVRVAHALGKTVNLEFVDCPV